MNSWPRPPLLPACLVLALLLAAACSDEPLVEAGDPTAADASAAADSDTLTAADAAADDSPTTDAATTETATTETATTEIAIPLPEYASVADCPAANPCLLATCTSKGTCVYSPKAAGSACDDGDACTQGDSCQGGQCLPGEVVCQCKTNSDCAKLEDGDLCNGQLYCDKAAGVPYTCKLNPATIVSCPTVNNSACQKNTCLPATGQCKLLLAPENTPCDDGNTCTTGDFCDTGLCQGGANTCFCKKDADCQAMEDGNLCNGTLFCNKATAQCQLNPVTVVSCQTVNDTQCRKNLCNPKVGKCYMVAAKDGQLCDDGNPCTPNEGCEKGECASAINSCECQKDADCQAKDDGNLCNGTLYCDLSAKTCKINPATVVTCNADDDPPCLADTCDKKTGKCQEIAAPKDGLACDDGNPCTALSLCGGGQCLGQTNTCECQKDSDCAGKEDGNLCNGKLFCNPKSSKCEVNPASLVVCTGVFDEPCLANQCDPKTGSCAMAAAHQGNSCEGGSICAAGGWCAMGACEVTAQQVCECTTDSDCAKVDDGDLCNGTLYCDKSAAGKPSCKVNPATVITCKTVDNTACSKALCQKASGKCAQVAVSGGCEDGLACTVKDACLQGSCVSLPASCDDGQACTWDVCQEPFGCVHLSAAASACDDGVACTADSCGADNTCQHKASAGLCGDGSPCTADSCDAIAGCSYAPAAGACNDGNLCTTGDTCKEGLCTAGTKIACADSQICTDDGCDPKTGCVFAPNSAACDDGSACTLTQACKGGSCTGLKLLICNDGNACTTDACDPKTGCVFQATTQGCDASPCTQGSVCKDGACVGGPVVQLTAGTLTLGNATRITGVAAFPAGDLAVVAIGGNHGDVARMGPAGQVKWQWQTSNFGSYSAVAVLAGDQLVAVGAPDGVYGAGVHGFDSQGKPAPPQSIVASIGAWKALAAHPAGGYWAVSAPDGYGQSVIARLDAKFAVLSMHLLGAGCLANAVVAFADGRALVAGSRIPAGSILAEGWLGVYGNDGKWLSEQKFADAVTHRQLTGLVARPGGGYAASGHVGSPSSGAVGTWWLLLDSAGLPTANATPEAEVNRWYRAVAATPDGGAVLAGAVLGVVGTADGLLTRIDAAGNVVWEQTYGAEQADEFFAVALRADGGIAAAGESGAAPWLVRADAWGNASCFATGQCLQVDFDGCDDKNPCTTDTCASTTGCNHAAAAAGQPCAVGKSCDAKGICAAK